MLFKSNNTRNLLEFKKKELEDYLLGREPESMGEYLVVCSALAGIEKSEVKHVIAAHEYAGHRNAIDAIQAYLENVKEFVDKEELTKAILEGGYAPNDERRKYNIIDSVRYHLKDRKNKNGDITRARLIQRDGKIGLADWENG